MVGVFIDVLLNVPSRAFACVCEQTILHKFAPIKSGRVLQGAQVSWFRGTNLAVLFVRVCEVCVHLQEIFGDDDYLVRGGGGDFTAPGSTYQPLHMDLGPSWVPGEWGTESSARRRGRGKPEVPRGPDFNFDAKIGNFGPVAQKFEGKCSCLSHLCACAARALTECACA